MKSIMIFALVFGTIAISRTIVFADTATSSLEVYNVLPESSAISIVDDVIMLTENTTTSVIITATVTDNNGCEDIDSTRVIFYRSDVGVDDGDDYNYHYTEDMVYDPDSCTPGGEDLTSTWTASVPLQYYADPTDVGTYQSSTWNATVIPSDGEEGSSGVIDSAEVATLLALDVTPNIDYGFLPLGGDTGTGDTISTITNTGNAIIGVQVDGYGANDGDGLSMTCTTGSLNIDRERYSAIPETAYDMKFQLSDIAESIPEFEISQRVDEITSGNIYWGFGLPTSGLRGNCTGTVVFTAI